MIEITHSQAQHLIRESLDRPIPESQWSALQVHLEHCAECRAYRDRRLSLVRGVARLLRDRWWTVMLRDGQAFPAEITQHRSQRGLRLRALRFALLALIAFVLITGYALYARLHRPASTPTPAATPAAQETVLTTTPRPGLPVGAPPQPGDFRGQVVFDAVDGLVGAVSPGAAPGAHEIYLLNQAYPPELTNLTAHPAHDYAPVWSPDGQWVAFLSDRDAAGTAEIYVMTVAGTRLTRLTAIDGYQWQPPLSWSADGRWLAATALTPTVSEGGLFLVPASGEGLPRLVINSRGGRYPRFAQATALLAFQGQDASGQPVMRVYDPGSGADLEIAAEPGVTLSEDGAFEWSADGYRLVFLSEKQSAPGRSEVKVVYSLPRLLAEPGTRVEPSQVLLSVPLESPLRSAGFTHEGEFIFARSNAPGGCALLYGNPSTDWQAGTAPLALRLPPVCLESPLERASWAQNSPWLVLAGQMGQRPAALYAMRIPRMNSRDRDVSLERLMDLPPGSGSPQVRPERPVSAGFTPLDPQPARTARAGPLPPEGLLERVLVTYTSGQSGAVTQSIARLSPAGLVNLENRLSFCPRRSPDGQRVAFVSSRVEPGPGWDGLFVMDLDSGMAVQVSNYDSLSADDFWGQERVVASLGGCPSWSPDGQRLATYSSTDKGLYLSVFGAAGGPGLFYQLNDGSTLIPPRWTSGSQRVAVARAEQRGVPAQVVTIYPDSGKVIPLAVSDGWQTVSDMAYSPDGRFLAFLASWLDDADKQYSELRLINNAGGPDVIASGLPTYPSGMSGAGYTGLTWLGGGRTGTQGRVGLSFQGKAAEGGRSALLLYDLATDDLNLLVSLDEDLRAAAWSPDGSWVIYSTSSGTFALHIPSALSGKGAPTWLGIGAVDDLNWR